MFKRNKKEPEFSSKKDAVIGMPLLFTLSGAMSQPEAELPIIVNNIAIVTIAPTREIFAMYKFINAIKNRYPASKLTFYTPRANKGAITAMFGVKSRVIDIYPESIIKSRNCVKKEDKYDLLIDFGRWSRYEAILSCYITAIYKIGFRSEGENRHYPYNKVADYNKSLHIIDNFNRLLNLINITIDSQYKDNRPCEKSTSKYIVVEMYPKSTSYSYKEWSPEHWGYLLSVLSKKGYRIGIIGAKEYATVAEEFIEGLGNADIDYLVGRLDLIGIAEEVKKAQFVIGIDYELVYIANFLGIKAICLHNSVNSLQYTPQSKDFYSVIPEQKCAGCKEWYYDEQCILDNNVCMSYISINSVEKHIAEITASE